MRKVADRGDILIVDDEEDIITFLTTVLSHEGFSVRTARTGSEAMAAVRLSRPVLVILDMLMPDVNGADVLDTLHGEIGASLPAVIVLSSRSSHKDILDVLQRGASDFVSKPFDLDDLLLRIRVWIDRATATETTPTTLRVYTLSPFRVLLDERLLMDEQTGDGRSRLILKYLITHANHAVDRDSLLYRIWPDLDSTDAAQQLDSRVAQLADTFSPGLPGRSYIIAEGGAFRFDTSRDFWCDADEFEAQVRLAQQAQESGDMDTALATFLGSLSLYTKDYLCENIYDDWPSDRREKLRELWISALFRSGAITADRCEFSDSIRFMKRVLEADPYRENAYQALMLYLARAGRRGEAIQLYRYAERLFAQDLAARPAPSTRMLYEKILKGEVG